MARARVRMVGWLADGVLALTLAAVAIVTTAVLGWTPQVGVAVDTAGVLLLGAAGLVLVTRRWRPLATLAAVTVVITAYLLLGNPYGLVFLPFAVAVYTVARRRPVAVSALASVGAVGLLLSHLLFDGTLVGGDEEALVGLLFGVAWAAVPYAVGVTVRAREEVAARDRAELIRVHVDEERLRVAQEVHDIVGHGLAAIKMQADVALHVLPKQPEQAPTALVAISRTSGEALAELRTTLAAVREPGDDRAPAPGLAQLDGLRQRMAEAGLLVSVVTEGPPRPLPPAVDLAGYRLVQESLTNVLRHSSAAQATVTIGYAAAQVAVIVTNPVDRSGSGGDGSGSGGDDGSGIPGMRRRVRALGGTFSAGPTATGFQVHARIPTGGPE